MGVRTSAITYSRGVPPQNQANFFIVAQANYNVVVPMNKYLNNYSLFQHLRFPH